MIEGQTMLEIEIESASAGNIFKAAMISSLVPKHFETLLFLKLNKSI